MRKLSLVVLTVLVGLLLYSCAESNVNTSDLPDFYLNPPIAEDAIYGVGDAKMSSLSLSRTTAVSRARNDIAFQVETLVKAAITDYAQEAGSADDKQTIEFVETISRQIANITLAGAKTKEFYVSKDGTVFALVEYATNNLLTAAKEEFQRNEAAAFAEFKADQAVEKLNYELENNPPRAGQAPAQ